MKKELGKILSLVVAIAFVAGCSSSPQVNNAQVQSKKVDSVKISQITSVDLGNQNGTSVSLRVGVERGVPKFGIKAVYPGWDWKTTLGPLQNIIRVQLYNNANTNIKARWDSVPLSMKDLPNNGPMTMVFKNLAKSTSYFIAARAYSNDPIFNTNAGFVDTAVSAGASMATLTSNGSTTWNTVGGNQVLVGDLIEFDPDGPGTALPVRSEVTSVTTNSTLNFRPPVTITAGGNVPYSIYRNVTGIGTIGDVGGFGMAADANQQGGGTAPALSAPGPGEENVIVDGTGAVTFPVSTGNSDTTWDINVQLMKEIGSSVDGAVSVTSGAAASGNEVIN